jgi:hypothetical protein
MLSWNPSRWHGPRPAPAPLAPELDANRGLVFEDYVDVEDVAVEVLRRLQIVNKEADRADLLERPRQRPGRLDRSRVLIELRQVVADFEPETRGRR